MSINDKCNGRMTKPGGEKENAVWVWQQPSERARALSSSEQDRIGREEDGLISLGNEAVQRGIAPGKIALWIENNGDAVHCVILTVS